MKTENGLLSMRLEFLKEKERKLRTQLVAEQIKIRRRIEKEDARLFALVGRALVQHATQHPDFGLMLIQVLRTVDLRESDRAFLKSRNWQ